MGWLRFDRQFPAHPLRYLFQCGLATAVVVIVLCLTDAVNRSALVGAIGASAFVAFAFPAKNVSKPRYLLGGYAVGLLVGIGIGLLARHVGSPDNPVVAHTLQVIMGAMAVGVAIFVMTITNTEHPPAAGVALGMVMDKTWGLGTVALVACAILALCLLKEFARPVLIDLA